ncbi:MAG: CidA/LrgA family protein [Candidatus Faecousia sp.]|nr:CidA/LrgA family protein [Candidatus Faecousia sp.]
MKYLSQFLRITAFTLTGELLQRIVPLPIPASVYGLVLLFAALYTGAVKLEQVKDVGGFLISILPILFVSPAVGILENWGLIKNALIPMFLLALASTITTFAIAGRVTQALRKKEDKPNASAGKP